MKKFFISINGNNSPFLASRMSSFIHSKILRVTDTRREKEYLDAFATNMGFSSE